MVMNNDHVLILMRHIARFPLSTWDQMEADLRKTGKIPLVLNFRDAKDFLWRSGLVYTRQGDGGLERVKPNDAGKEYLSVLEAEATTDAFLAKLKEGEIAADSQSTAWRAQTMEAGW